MTTPANAIARSVKISVSVADGDFPIAAIPPKGTPGSAKARVLLRLRTQEGMELSAEPTAKGLQKALDAAQAAPGGFWVTQGKLVLGGVMLEAGVVYQPPKGAEGQDGAGE
ncbi:MAG: hypothetical protein ACRYGM_07190 [Janthinobacterium lividum]